MIQTKINYLNYLESIKSITKNLDISSLQELERIKSNITNIELIVPIVGGFSAGKSTLINSYLQTNILPTGITPETALATELRYSNEEFIDAIKNDDTIQRYSIEQIEEIKNNATNYKYIRLHLNNDKLKQIEPLILVDMPGFDSPLELHNQAILNYLNKGIYFIVLTSVEEGNIQKSTLRELENITEFGKGFSFCLSKINLRAKNDVFEIEAKIKEQLDDYFNFKEEIVKVANTGGNELENILTTIDVEKLFEKIFLSDLNNNHIEIISSINTIISTLQASQEESNNAIKELQASIDKIIDKKNNMIEKTKSKYSEAGVDNIIESVARALSSNIENLTTLALSNNDGFSREINDIVKNTLIYEVKNKMQDTSSDIVDNFSIELKDVVSGLSNFELGDKWLNTISESTKNLIKDAQNGLSSVINNRDTTSTNNLYKGITAILGITTTMINPLLEVVIVFLPEIIAFFTAKSKEAKKKAEISNKLNTEIIPSIKSKIRSVLPDIYNNQVKSIIEIISDQFEKQLKTKELEISKTQETKSNNIKDIEIEIEKLNSVKVQLKDLARTSLNGVM